MLESLSNTVKCVQTIRLATLLKRDPRTGVSVPAIRRSSTKIGVPVLESLFKESLEVDIRQMFFKTIVLKKFANFLFNKVAGP